MQKRKKALPLHSQLRAIAQMAESVDALVSNTSGATHPGSIPGLGTKRKSRNAFPLLLFTRCEIIISRQAISLHKMPEIIKNILIAGSGSFIGGAARYFVMELMKNCSKGWGTIAVNLAGCFLIGVLWGVSVRQQEWNPTWTTFLIAGVCGGFTTFSTFSKDALGMLQDGDIASFFAYAATSIIAGIALTAIGYCIAK